MNPTPDDCFHLSVPVIEEIHAESLARFGGSPGTRDQTLLESAAAAPQAGFAGQSIFKDLIEVAAAYLFYLCRNHPFIDGNKRTALGACLVFLRMNGIVTPPDGEEWEQLTLDVAASRLNREQTTERLRALLER